MSNVARFLFFFYHNSKKKKKNRNKKKNVHSVSWTVDGDTNTALETEASPKKHSPDYLVFHNKTSNQTARILLNTRTRPKHEWKSVSSFEDSVAGSSSAFFEQMCPLLSQNKEQTTERKKKNASFLCRLRPLLQRSACRRTPLNFSAREEQEEEEQEEEQEEEEEVLPTRMWEYWHVWLRWRKLDPPFFFFLFWFRGEKNILVAIEWT